MKLRLSDYAHLLKKGWKRFNNGNEYVYDYKLPDCPIIIKIFSTVKVDENEKANKGSHQIRVFAVKLDKNGKICGGYIKSQRVNITLNWLEDVKTAFRVVRKQVYVRARKEKIICVA